MNDATHETDSPTLIATWVQPIASGLTILMFAIPIAAAAWIGGGWYLLSMPHEMPEPRFRNVSPGGPSRPPVIEFDEGYLAARRQHERALRLKHMLGFAPIALITGTAICFGVLRATRPWPWHIGKSPKSGAVWWWAALIAAVLTLVSAGLIYFSPHYLDVVCYVAILAWIVSVVGMLAYLKRVALRLELDRVAKIVSFVSALAWIGLCIPIVVLGIDMLNAQLVSAGVAERGVGFESWIEGTAMFWIAAYTCLGLACYAALVTTKIGIGRWTEAIPSEPTA